MTNYYLSKLLSLDFSIRRKFGSALIGSFLLFVAVFATFKTNAQCYTPPNYCTSIGATNVANYQMGIQQVTLGTSTLPTQINNLTASGTGAPIYFNYTNLIVRALASDTINYSIRVGAGNSTTFRIYIDYNNDGTFATTAPELVLTSPQTNANLFVNGSFILPSTLAAGAYRIRIASDGLNQIASPCGPIFYSAEYEDYTLLVPSSTADLISGTITQPASPFVGNNTVAFNFTNLSTVTITSVDIYYQLNNNTPVSQSLSSLSIAPGATYTATFTTQVSIPAVGTYLLRTWTDNPNFAGNNTPGNDTICRSLATYCSGPLAGTYTINPAGSGATNFRTFGAADSAITSCGVSAPVVFNVSPGTYNEQVTFFAVPGASATNNVVFNCAGSTMEFNCTAANPALIRFQGAKHITFDSLTVRSTSNTFGWGLHFLSNADSNTFKNGRIEITNVTSSTSNNSAGIVFSSSLTSVLTSGNNGAGNLFQNNVIKGSTASFGLYYGIVGFPQSSFNTYSGNQFINNRIEDFFQFGIYWQNGNRTVFRGNVLTRATKVQQTTVYGFYLSSQSRFETFDRNEITNIFNGSPTYTGTFFGWYMINYSGANSTTESNLFTNNLLHKINGNGPQYGFYLLTSFNNRFYNNTLLFDNINNTTTSQTWGLYFTGGTSAFSTIDFRNNLIAITRGGTGQKLALNVTGSWATGATVNRNAYFGNASNYNLANYLGVNYLGLTQWRAALTVADQQSIEVSPNFTNPASNVYSPRDGAYNGSGDTTLLATVPVDFTGATRTNPMDIGAWEASPISVDGAMAEIVVPATPYLAGLQNINVKIRNAGINTIDSAMINWSVNGVPQTPVMYTGPLGGGAVSGNILLGSVNLTVNTLFNITATLGNVNGSADPNPDNNSLSSVTAPASAGTLTVNAAGTGAGVFQNFTNVATLLSVGGVSGPVTINVVTGSGPYTEQLFFRTIPGVSATNNIVVNGNGNTIQFNNIDPSNIGIINLIGADYFTFNNLTVRSLNASYGIGYIFTAGADFNKILNNTIDIGSVTGSSLSAGIAFTGSLGNPTTTGINGSNNLIENNQIIGNSTGGPYYAIAYQPQAVNNGVNTFNVFKNNILRDFTVFGFYVAYSAGTTYSGNVLSRPTKTSPTTFYGFYMVNSVNQDTIENNVIKQPYQALQTTTGTFYGYFLIATNTQTNRPIIIRNNQMYDIRFNGTIYGFYQLSASNIRLFNNIFVVDHPTSTSTSVTYLYYNSGTPTTTTIRNNIWFLNRGGSGAKYIYYLATTGAGYVINNNVVHLKQTGTNNFVGFHGGNITTFTAWRAVNASAYDQNSVSADPLFRLSVGPEYYMPGSDTVNNIGFVTADVPRDVTGALRNAITPDPGAYEFGIYGDDAGLTRITSPINPISLGTQNVNVLLKNFGTNTLTTSFINWTVNDSVQSPNLWSGLLAKDDTVTTSAGTFNFLNPGVYRIKAWTSMPNSTSDSFPVNDTASITVCTALSGNLFVNAAIPTNDSTFNSITAVTQLLQTCGVNGPVVVNIAPGTYNGSLTFTGKIPGSSPINTITYRGADSSSTKIVHTASGQRATILVDGAKYLVFRNLTIESNALSGGGYGVLFTNSADSNSVIRSTVRVAQLTIGFTTFAGIASSGNALNLNFAGNNGNVLLVDSCTIIGGYYGVNFFNNTTTKSVGNVIRNSNFINPFYYGVYAYAQNGIVTTRNTITGSGNGINTFACPLYYALCDNGIIVTKNQTSNQLGGYGIFLTQNFGTSTNRNVIANNMFQLGAITYTTYGIYDAGNAFTDIAHNSVHNTSGDASYVSCALYLNYNNVSTSNNLRLVNNVFASPNGAMASWIPSTGSLSISSILANNNVYFSTSTYPYRIINTIYPALANYVTAMAVFVPGLDSLSIWTNPSFLSATNLRSINPQLDSIGIPIATVVDDIDGVTRSTVAPDAGVNEFAKPNDDAGVIAILQPSQPTLSGLTNVRVVVRNFGISTITSLNVHYNGGSTPVTRTITSTILPGATDTVTFDSTSGPGGTNQRFNFVGGLITFKAYTSQPNTVVDPQNLNDTAFLNICGALVGTYTINPSGSGANNFLTIGDAINRLTCGGVAGNVIFNIASGTYTGQFDMSPIAGTNDTSRILFRSLTGNPANVIITSATATPADNYTIRLRGVSFATFLNLTIRNTNVTNGRVFSINKWTPTNTNTNNLIIRNCILEGITTTSTSDLLAVVYGPNGDNATNIRIVNNQIRQGSYGVWMGGQNIINQFSPGLEIDSNNFVQAYWASINLTSRAETKIRNNFFDGNTSQGYYGIFLASTSGNTEISRNNFQLPFSTYGIYMATNGYYGETGVGQIKNNVINMLSTGTQYGIALFNTSNLYTMNNTVRLNSSATSYAYYYSGHSTTPAVPQVTASNNVRLFNNILWSNTGYAAYYANFQAITGTPQSDNNLYYTGGTNLIYSNGLNYTPAAFLTFRNAIYAGSDRRSLTSNISFTSSSNLSPLVTASNAWASNGRGVQSTFVTNDFNGANRSTMVATGATDIGAFEFTPTSTPPAVTFTGSIGGGNTQHMLLYGDTIGKLVWGFSGTLPSAISGTYHSGALISNPTNNGTITGAHYMDVFWRINATGGSFFNYDLDLIYDPNMLGTVPFASDLKMAKKPTGSGYWVHYGSTATTVDTVAMDFGVTGLSDFSDFTGTTDISPLPVALSSFEAVKEGSTNAGLYWNTASEIRSSHFIIERAVEYGKFEAIDKVKAAGNSNRMISYQFKDANVAEVLNTNVVFYRLKMVDLDGTFEYSQVRTVRFGDDTETDVTVFPVPFNNEISIFIAANEAGNGNIEVVNVMGSICHKSSFTIKADGDKVSLTELSNLPAGVYMIRVQMNNEWVVRKVIKQ